jgi:molybdopterin molybdotransferase
MPQGFGLIEGKPYWGLPGNPVSVFVSFEVFVRPAILTMMGRAQIDRPTITATLSADVAGPEGKLQFARVHVERGDEGWVANPTGARGSNLISTVSRANALAMIPPGVKVAAAGSPVRVMVFRASED